MDRARRLLRATKHSFEPARPLEVGPDPEVPAAERDAQAILARVQADENAADRARDAFDRHPVEPLVPDADVAHLLAPDERVIAVRRSVAVERRVRETSPHSTHGLAGDLYVTTKRIVLVGHIPLSIDLDEVEETILAGEQCLVVTRDGHGLALDAEQPRLLRVEIAAARSKSATRTHS